MYSPNHTDLMEILFTQGILQSRRSKPQALDDLLIILPGPLRTRDVIKACSLQLTENQPLRGIHPAALPRPFSKGLHTGDYLN